MDYTAYFGIKFHEDHGNRVEIEEITHALKNNWFKTVCVARDFEKWGQCKFSPKELMKKTFEEIYKCDLVILEMSEKGVGLGIEAG
ncbi:MAG: nucleoside 2-deoxyribosyltransferase [Proteobacteria bacterium]|nr:nucleoside 2-deoxyribosyltransferase [Pseudomonadota bacterium]MBU4471950.1 nucleoside 2-deoxyribosyltransferase [Pseudomonadota bacterium]MCG2753418.1 hypothetical protein [Desulfobacteraceae bacterium]